MPAPDRPTGAGRPGLPWDALSRTLAGGLGGHALAQVLPVALVAPWGLPRAEAVLTAMMLGLAVHAAAFMAAFATRSAWRAWLGLGLCVAGSALAAWLAL